MFKNRSNHNEILRINIELTPYALLQIFSHTEINLVNPNQLH